MNDERFAHKHVEGGYVVFGVLLAGQRHEFPFSPIFVKDEQNSRIVVAETGPDGLIREEWLLDDMTMASVIGQVVK